MLRKSLFVAVFGLLFAMPALAQTYHDSGGTIVPAVVPLPYAYTPLCPGQHNLAPTTATALTLPTGLASNSTCVTTAVTALYATICASTAPVNYTTDGTTTPTTTVGQPLATGACVSVSGAAVLANFRAISATGTLDIEYFR